MHVRACGERETTWPLARTSVFSRRQFSFQFQEQPTTGGVKFRYSKANFRYESSESKREKCLIARPNRHNYHFRVSCVEIPCTNSLGTARALLARPLAFGFSLHRVSYCRPQENQKVDRPITEISRFSSQNGFKMVAAWSLCLVRRISSPCGHRVLPDFVNTLAMAGFSQG